MLYFEWTNQYSLTYFYSISAPQPYCRLFHFPTFSFFYKILDLFFYKLHTLFSFSSFFFFNYFKERERERKHFCIIIFACYLIHNELYSQHKRMANVSSIFAAFNFNWKSCNSSSISSSFSTLFSGSSSSLSSTLFTRPYASSYVSLSFQICILFYFSRFLPPLFFYFFFFS